MELRLTSLASLCLCLLSMAAGAQAQPFYQPGIGAYSAPVNPVSPFINLANGNPAVSYFGLVQPQIQLQRAYSQLQQASDTQMQSAVQNAPVMTGHGVQFMSFNRYFMRTPINVPGTANYGGLLAGPQTAAGAGPRFGSRYSTPGLQRGFR
jgi:hypothetical protein